MRRSVIALSLCFAILAGCSESTPAPQSTGAQSGQPETSQTAALDASVPAEGPSGEEIYGEYCFSCHAAGISGAPKLGDQEAWAPRIAKGKALLLKSTIEGIPPAMPPRGICMSCSDEELAAAVDYMVAQSQ